MASVCHDSPEVLALSGTPRLGASEPGTAGHDLARATLELAQLTALRCVRVGVRGKGTLPVLNERLRGRDARAEQLGARHSQHYCLVVVLPRGVVEPGAPKGRLAQPHSQQLVAERTVVGHGDLSVPKGIYERLRYLSDRR